MPGDDNKLLVTSNTCIRVYDGYTLACKYKGHKNNNSQIRASFSPGAEFIVLRGRARVSGPPSTLSCRRQPDIPGTGETSIRPTSNSPRSRTSPPSRSSRLTRFDSRGGRRATAGGSGAAAKTQLQPTKAAEALFHGNMTSPNFALVSRPSNEGTTHSRNGSNEDAVKVAESAEVGGEGGDAPGDGGEAEEEAMSPRELARLEGELAFAAGMAIGQIIVTAGYSGEIRIFENVGPPQWI